MTVPECGTYADVERLDGQLVALVGTYERVDVRARPTPPPVFDGHAAVRLDDGHLVLIEPMWAQQAIRSDDEVARADRRAVRVTGVIRKQCPEPPEPTTSIVGPCVNEVEHVEVI